MDQLDDLSPSDSADRADRALLDLLLFEPGLGLWAVNELERATGGNVDDALWRLHREGLIHLLSEGVVWASRAAVRSAALLDPESARASWTPGLRD